MTETVDDVQSAVELVGDRALLKYLPPETVTPGGIELPEGTEEQNLETIRGCVVALGSGVQMPMDAAIGNVAIFCRYDAKEVKLHGFDDTFYVIDAEKVLLVIRNGVESAEAVC